MQAVFWSTCLFVRFALTFSFEGRLGAFVFSLLIFSFSTQLVGAGGHCPRSVTYLAEALFPSQLDFA